MPELPEVESIRRKLNTILPDQRILEYKSLDLKTCRFSENDFAQIKKRNFQTFRRWGKHLIGCFENCPAALHIHLGMTGFAGVTRSIPQTDFLRLFFTLNKGYLYLDDMRKFGFIEIQDLAGLKQKVLAGLGPDALMGEIDACELYLRAQKLRRPVHSVLLDQRFLAGIGNIYAAEILFDSRVNPFKHVSFLSIEEWWRIINSMHKILSDAVSFNGSTFVHHPARTMDERFRKEFLQVYGREGEPCPRCRASLVRTKSQRSIYFCPSCQE